MLKIKVTTKGQAFNTARMSKAWEATIRRWLMKVLLILEAEVAKNTPVGVTGTLRAGVRSKALKYNEGIVGVEGPGAKYAGIREVGRKPGRMPPPDAIKLWLRRTDKGRAFVDAVARRYKIKDKNRALSSAAFLKARAIGRRGYKGAWMFRDAEKAKRQQILRLAEDLKFQLAKEFTK